MTVGLPSHLLWVQLYPLTKRLQSELLFNKNKACIFCIYLYNVVKTTPHFSPMCLHLQQVPADLRSFYHISEDVEEQIEEGQEVCRPKVTDFKMLATQKRGKGATVGFVSLIFCYPFF